MHHRKRHSSITSARFAAHYIHLESIQASYVNKTHLFNAIRKDEFDSFTSLTVLERSEGVLLVCGVDLFQGSSRGGYYYETVTFTANVTMNDNSGYLQECCNSRSFHING